ncbi:MAG: hypothetical protein FWH05_00655 [Oscillospiraceae bacterium]|nr:hypothetical protein [Oscillospiraceae bacterium]
MKICNNCQKSLGEGDRFCHACGESVEGKIEVKSESTPVTASNDNPQWNNLYPGGAQREESRFYTAAPRAHVLERLKTGPFLPLLKAAIVLLILNSIFSIISLVVVLNTDVESLYSTNFESLTYQYREILEAMLTSVAFFTAGWIVISALLLVGLIKCRSTCLNDSFPFYKTAGPTLIKASGICSIVVTGLFGFLLFAFASRSFNGAVSTQLESQFYALFYFILTLGLAIAAVLPVSIFISIITTANKLKVIFTEEPNSTVKQKLGLFLPVVMFVGGGLNALQVLTLLFKGTLLELIAMLPSTAFLIILPIAYLKFRKEYMTNN